MSELQQAIRRVVEKVGDPPMEQIKSEVNAENPGDWTDEEIRECVIAMVHRGELRMKDDDYEHDWTYRKGRNW